VEPSSTPSEPTTYTTTRDVTRFVRRLIAERLVKSSQHLTACRNLGVDHGNDRR
jgi:hypothetical protein